MFIDDLANCGCFYSIGGRCYSGWWLWDLRALAQSQGSVMSPGLFQDFMVFVSGFTQGNENGGSVQDFILLFLCKSGELGGRGNPRFPCVTSVVGSFSSDFLRAVTGKAALRVLSNIHHGALPRK